MARQNEVPKSFSNFFTKEDIEDILAEERENMAQIKLKQNKLKPNQKKHIIQPKKTIRSPKNIILNKPSTCKLSRKKLFNGQQPKEADELKVKVNNKIGPLMLNRKSTSLLNLSEIENQANFRNCLEIQHKPNRISAEEEEFIKLEKKLQLDVKQEIETILEDDHTEFCKLQKEFEKFTIKHDDNMKRISKLLSDFAESSSCSTTRKETLTVNKIVPNICIADDHGMEKAVNLYNSMRKKCTMLTTPKLNRQCLQTPKSTFKSKDISRVLQKQCLLLVDTPMK
ncbi:hypothetical protein FQR65_LT13907 [Abscondita terminalis]|nr:hypothetical protein FQR65_LT13907 [Abscondita terminalis]